MLLQLFTQQWKKKLRSPFWTQSVVQSIVLGLFALYFILMFLGLGLVADKLIEETFPGADPFVKFSGFILYYFLMDILIRFFMQKFPAIGIKPYLTLPISKNKIAHFLLLKSLPSFFNILPLFFVIPFFFKTVLPQQPLNVSMAWLAMALVLIVASNYISYFIDKALGVKPVFAATLIAILVGAMYLDFSGYIPLGDYLEQLAMTIIQQPVFLLIPLGAILTTYYGLYTMFGNHAYLEEQDASSSGGDVQIYDLKLFDRFGKPGEVMDLETKLIWRNKRSRTFLYISVAFVLYPLILMGEENFSGLGFMLVMGLLMTGAFTLNYGQLMLAWNSPHFDLLLTRNVKIEDIFRGKYYLLALSNLALFTLSLPYVFMDSRFLMTNIAMFLFNSGVTVFLYMILACYSSKRIDPGKGSMFNYEGFGAAHYVIIIPIIILPMLIYLPFGLTGHSVLGVVVVGLVGLIGIIFRDVIIRMAVRTFEKRKHQIALAFRKK